MGIRMHKAIGYGAIHPAYEFLASRLYDLEHVDEVDELITTAAKNETNRTAQLQLQMEKRFSDTQYPKFFHDIVRNTSSVDEPSADAYTLIIPPSQYKSWSRYDDMIDLIELRIHHPTNTIKTTVNILDYPLYPYVFWMHPETGKDTAPLFAGQKRRDNITPVPAVPHAVRHIAKEVGFPDWKVLRPMMATWWG